MRIIDIIEKKRDHGELSREELQFWVDGVVNRTIEDYQTSALLMAIVLNGMNPVETATLTDIMMHSGDVIDLSDIAGIKCDKHSTGGVGDKTSLALGPMCAACGVKIAKMSGRGLGHTGGTLDKLESIPGFNCYLDEEQFKKQVNDIGISIIGQTAKLVPADKRLYALRDVTGTVESIPLIASSIMSKKLASGSDTILLDVKFGEGAFMKDVESAKKLANAMIEIGTHLGRDVKAMISDMNQPLGNAIGNALEVKEAVDTLHGKGPADFEELCLQAGEIMLMQAKITSSKDEGRAMLKRAIADGSAFEKLKDMVKAQGGDISVLEDTSKLPIAKNVVEMKAKEDGYIADLHALEMGNLSMRIGAGRATAEDSVDHAVGIVLNAKKGDYVKAGDVLAYVHTNMELSDEWIKDFYNAYDFTSDKMEKDPIIYAVLG